MPITRPRRLTPRGIVSTLLPSHFTNLRHSGQKDPEDVMAVKVPWDVFDDQLRKNNRLDDWRKALVRKYEANASTFTDRDKPKIIPMAHRTNWCVTSGSWIERPLLEAVNIFPMQLGSGLLNSFMGEGSIYSDRTGLLLPAGGVSAAVKDFALVITPHDGEIQPSEIGGDTQCRFRVVDETHPTMSMPILKTGHSLTVAELDQAPLYFANRTRPLQRALYFHACLAIWKKTFLQDPTCQDEEDFGKRFLQALEPLWQPRPLDPITDVFLMKRRESKLGDQFTMSLPSNEPWSDEDAMATAPSEKKSEERPNLSKPFPFPIRTLNAILSAKRSGQPLPTEFLERARKKARKARVRGRIASAPKEDFADSFGWERFPSKIQMRRDDGEMYDL